MCVICSARAEIFTESRRISRRAWTRSTATPAALTILSPIARIVGSNSATSNSEIAFVVFCIWSMASIHRRDEILDVTPVEGGYESPAHRNHDFTHDGVSGFFFGRNKCA